MSQKAHANATPQLFNVKAYIKGKWKIVTDQPLPRSEAAMIVAEQWAAKSYARLERPAAAQAA